MIMHEVAARALWIVYIGRKGPSVAGSKGEGEKNNVDNAIVILHFVR